MIDALTRRDQVIARPIRRPDDDAQYRRLLARRDQRVYAAALSRLATDLQVRNGRPQP